MLWIFVFIGLIVLSIVGLVISNKYWHTDWAYWHTDWADWLMPILVIVLIAGILFGFISIMCYCEARAKVVQFEETREIIVMSVESGTDLENIGITQTIIDCNEWLAKAKASAKTFGVWSSYYGLGVEDMEYIKLGGG